MFPSRRQSGSPGPGRSRGRTRDAHARGPVPVEADPAPATRPRDDSRASRSPRKRSPDSESRPAGSRRTTPVDRTGPDPDEGRRGRHGRDHAGRRGRTRHDDRVARADAAHGRDGARGPDRKPARSHEPRDRGRSRGTHFHVGGTLGYRGHQRGGHIIVGLFDRKRLGTPLAYWVNLEEPGPFMLEGLEPGEYELHGCLAPRINEEGMPVEVLASGSFAHARRIVLPSTEPFDRCDFEIFDEIPTGLIHGVDTVFVEVADMDRSVRFYRDLLGLSLDRREENWAEFDLGSTCFALRRRQRPTPGGRRPTAKPPQSGSIAVLRVEDIDRTRLELIERGVNFVGRVGDSEDGRWATFEDVDGNLLQLMQRKPRS